MPRTQRKAAKSAIPVVAAEAVLGSILSHPACFNEIDLVPEDFEYDWQRMVFETITTLLASKQQIDAVTVAETLNRSTRPETTDLEEGVTWLGHLSRLVQETPTWRNVTSYAKLVKDRSLERKAISISMNLAHNVSEDSSYIDTAVKDLMALQRTDRRYSMRLGDRIGDACDALERRVEGKTVVGLPTGLSKLDGALGGLAPENLYIIGARPAMGKTTLGLQILLHNSKVASGFMSTEMPTDKLVERACANISGVSFHAMRLGKVSDPDWPKITEAYATIAQMPIYVNDQPSPTPMQVYRQARQWKYEHDIKILVVDYIQHLKLKDVRDKTPLLAEAVVGFKELSRELKIPVVLLAQINRSVESRADKRPNLGDFKDTGALEEEGDVVLSQYRDEVYYPKNVDVKGIIEIAILKNRHGPTAYLRAHYNAACLRIDNIDTAANDNY